MERKINQDKRPSSSRIKMLGSLAERKLILGKFSVTAEELPSITPPLAKGQPCSLPEGRDEEDFRLSLTIWLCARKVT